MLAGCVDAAEERMVDADGKARQGEIQSKCRMQSEGPLRDQHFQYL